ncbi:MAG TPA: hypothetical protein VHD55_02865 [Candidatus Paceibacterota bacterium]|nr:hypothetical protein [Candidatus Paceibacterota bacterium]
MHTAQRPRLIHDSLKDDRFRKAAKAIADADPQEDIITDGMLIELETAYAQSTYTGDIKIEHAVVRFRNAPSSGGECIGAWTELQNLCRSVAYHTV